MTQDQHEYLPYPEAHPRRWAIVMPMSLKEIEEHLSEGLTGDRNSPRHKAYKATLDAVHTLEHRGVTQFRGDKVHRLLIAAAREHGWFKKPTGYKARPEAQQPDHKVCRACMEEKPIAAFRAVATPEQKRKHGWGDDSKRFITSLLCDKCRVAKARREARHATKRQAPSTLSAFKASITKALEAVHKVLKRHEVTLQDGTTFHQFDSTADQDYYLTRRALVRAARDRLNEYVDTGTLLSELPNAQGLWHELLTDAERAQLKNLYAEGSWFGANRARTPVLWERATNAKPQTTTVVEKPSEPTATVVDWEGLL